MCLFCIGSTITSANKKVMRAEFRASGPLTDVEEPTPSSFHEPLHTKQPEEEKRISIESAGHLLTRSHTHHVSTIEKHASLLEEEDADDVAHLGNPRFDLNDPTRECRTGLPGAGDCSGCFETSIDQVTHDMSTTPLTSCCERDSCMSNECNFLYLAPSENCPFCPWGEYCCSEVKCQSSCADAGAEWRPYPTG